MAVLASTLVEAVRQRSGLRNNQFYTDSDILAFLTLSKQELRDEIQKANEHHLMVPFDFALAGGIDDCSVALPDDFIQGHSVDLNPDLPNVETVHYLSNWLQRNDARYRARARYFFRAGNLVMYPPEQCAGNYRLWYTPSAEPFAAPITVEFALASGDIPTVPPVGILAGAGSWSLTNAAFNDQIPEDESVILTLAFQAPNASFSGDYPIVEIGLASEGYGLPTASCNNLVSTAGYTGPPTGTGEYTYQPIGTTNELEPELVPYKLFLILHSSIQVRSGREQDVSDLNQELNGPGGYRHRVQASVTNRAEEPTQPPLTNRAGQWFDGDGFGFNGSE